MRRGDTKIAAQIIAHRPRSPQWVTFVREFLRNPQAVGSILPSSPVLARAIAEAIPRTARTVVELGPGTGALTRSVLAQRPELLRLLAVEIDPDFCTMLQQTITDPRLLIVNRPAEDLADILAPFGGQADAIICALPLMNFPGPLRNQITAAMHSVLPPGGVAIGFTYTPFVIPHIYREAFGNCRTRLVLRNVPPAFTVRSVR